MTGSSKDFEELARALWQKGIAGFCPTTLSASESDLTSSVQKIGAWIRKAWNKSGDEKTASGALPLGIHLEGPFLSPMACGAHPKNTIRAFNMQELESLYEASQKTLKLLTIAPELLSPEQLLSLKNWAKRHEVILSAGHSQATEHQGHTAFENGFSGVTHAWNALAFHHRSPGILGAALGRPGTHLEVIIDQVHLAPTLIRWMKRLHAGSKKGRLCFISDCVSAAETTTGSHHAFGTLQVHFADGASRTKGGHLAGGGRLLSDAFHDWILIESQSEKIKPKDVLISSLAHLTEHPLQALQLQGPRWKKFQKTHQVQWVATKAGSYLPEPLTSL
jgi:N-acetylglucosamine-6-phosphate deacetylase